MTTSRLTPLLGKRVLLLAPAFYSLHNQIIKELEVMGAIVGFIPDIVQKFNPLFGTSSLKWIKRIYYKLFNPNRKYHNQHSDILSAKWDYFLCIDGYSFDEHMFSLVKESNPKVKSYLYLWDSLDFFNFKHSFSFFDKVYTFDPLDSNNHKIEYFPLYWDRQSNLLDLPLRYNFSFVGTMHTDRFRILKSIAEQCEKNKWTYNFKLVINNKKSSFFDNLRYLIYRHINTSSAIGFVDEYRLKNNIEKCDFVYFNQLSSVEVQDCINSSEYIIDIANPLQSGITNRAIAGLASGKKVLTTVKLIDGIISNHSNISYLDRNHPAVHYEPLNYKHSQQTGNNGCDTLLFLRIDNWLIKILEL